MASIEEAMIAYLDSDSELGALIGDRIFDTVLPPETVLPAITFTVVGPVDLEHSKGVEAAKAYFPQIDVWAAGAASRRQVAAIVGAKMRVFRGSYGGIVVVRALLDGLPWNTTEAPLSGASDQMHRNISRWKVLVTEPAAVAF